MENLEVIGVLLALMVILKWLLRIIESRRANFNLTVRMKAKPEFKDGKPVPALIEVKTERELFEQYEKTRKPGEEWSMVFMHVDWHHMHIHGTKEEMFDVGFPYGLAFIYPYKGFYIRSPTTGHYRAIVMERADLLAKDGEEIRAKPEFLGRKLWVVTAIQLVDDLFVEARSRLGTGSPSHIPKTGRKTAAIEESFEEFGLRFQQNNVPPGMWSMALLAIAPQWFRIADDFNLEISLVLAGRQIMRSFPEGYFIQSLWGTYLGLFPGTPDEVKHKIEQGIIGQSAWIPGAKLWRVLTAEIKDAPLKRIADKLYHDAGKWYGSKHPID